jgi:hypothetical protein
MLRLLLAILSCRLAGALQQDTNNPVEHIRLRNAVVELGHHVEISANVTEVEGKQAWVDVSFSGVRDPSFDDWIGVFAPADADVMDSTPVKYKLASDSPEYFKNGDGSIR